MVLIWSVRPCLHMVRFQFIYDDDDRGQKQEIVLYDFNLRTIISDARHNCMKDTQPQPQMNMIVNVLLAAVDICMCMCRKVSNNATT